MKNSKVWIKFCGFNNLRDCQEVIGMGVDAIGFNFYKKSKRYVNFEIVEEFLPEIRDKCEIIGLFVNSEISEIKDVWQSNLFSAVQLHGDEGIQYCDELISAGINVIKAIRIRKISDVEEYAKLNFYKILLDSFDKKEYGGTGLVGDWQLIREVAENYSKINFILAGGLTPENVNIALKETGFKAVDTASGIEISKNSTQKDYIKCLYFIKNCRESS